VLLYCSMPLIIIVSILFLSSPPASGDIHLLDFSNALLFILNMVESMIASY
jgi:hypothetical protein